MKKKNYAGQSSGKFMKLFKKILLYTVLLFGVLATLFPFFYMIVLATRGRSEIFSYPPPLWFGDSLAENYNSLMASLPFYKNILNSLIVSTSATVLTLFFCALGGYGFAKYEFKGKNKLFFLMLSTMMIPMLLGVIPWYIMMTEFGWLNSFKPLIIPGAANAFGIFLMTQFMEDIPDELMEAARIDGAGEFEMFYKIVLPLSLPGLGTLAILTFLGSWNNYMQALLVLESEAKYTIPVALSMLRGKVDQNWGAQMVGTAMGIAPIIGVFMLASKQFIAGITEGSIKG
ncbi:carbohydrate ABC transporter permease [Halanaerobium saccharolyticum]|jgi:multiple sugar transport system permease protein|uniref:Carbohydrate ABC transporter membrane protein 2 (CUT1 family) n=1 Tax=Halanaerobium saccharolyticum TaxID=43595 RepID=A0A2T5RQB6_9FIRM|nr:carbohydrate ABC transporter permease [Halanaerobium saccharolyticum]PTW02149.1 carbohydrate ABC transporter membrane protein 2 (CUT1 family) [Halanaerobium saccharolyticum]TDQ01726.1 carbohydrate ABC transporter membrane protein 2 (CUT1 family) [Halanaerobium saccharolyticum]